MNNCIRNDWRSGGAAEKVTPFFCSGLGVVDRELLAARADARDAIAAEGDLCHRAVIDVLEERRIGHLLHGAGARAEVAHHRREHDGDDDPQDDVLGQIVQSY
jgi:hypothetical protein